jgi:Zn-dependent protease
MLSGKGISLGRIFGIQIELDYSWFLIFGLLTWALGAEYYPAEFSNWPTYEYYVVGAATAIMLFVSVLVHELAHSVVAMRYGIPVHDITLFLLGGASQIEDEPSSASSEFLIAFAGPATSAILGGIFYLLVTPVTSVPPLLALIKYLAYINVALAVFNLIPGFPLDGGRVLASIVWGISGSVKRATAIAGNVGRLIGFAFILLGVFLLFTVSFFTGIWMAFIGWFMISAAGAEIKQQQIENLLDGHKVSEAMSQDYMMVSSGETLQQLVNDHILGSGRQYVIVEQGDRTIGLLTVGDVKKISRDRWSETTVAQAMVPIEKTLRIAPDEQLWGAMKELTQDGVEQMPVMTDGHLQGMLSREDIISYLRSLQEFGS